MTIKIAYVFPNAEYYFRFEHQIHLLMKLNFKIYICCLNDEELYWELDNTEIHYLPITGVERDDRFIDLDGSTINLLNLFFQKENVDIVYAFYSFSSIGIVAAYHAKTPVRIFNITGLNTRKPQETKGNSHYNMLDSFNTCMSLSTHCVSDNYSVSKVITSQNNLTPGQKIDIVHHGSISGVNMKKFNRDNLYMNRLNTRKKLGFKHDDQVILFVGNVSPVKNISMLYQAFEKIRANQKKVHLLIVGHDNQGEENALPGVIRVPYTSNPEFFFAAANIFCMPSLNEGTCMAVLEAMAMKLPVVINKVTGLIDLITHNNDGLFFNGELQHLINALLRLIDDKNLSKKLGLRANMKIRQQYCSELHSKKLAQYFNQCLQQSLLCPSGKRA